MPRHLGKREVIRRVSPGLGAVIGLGVLVVMLQSSGGFAVELLGPDILLAATAFGLTVALLDEADGNAEPLGQWYRRNAALGTPLLVIVPALVLGALVLVGPYVQAGRSATEQLRAVLPTAETSDATLWDRIDPFGAMWLVELLVLFGVVWPLLLLALRWLLQRAGRTGLITPVLVCVATLACAVTPLLTLSGGTTVAELTLAPHIRASEWLVGAAAAAVVVATRRWSRPPWVAPTLAAFGGLVLVATAVAAAVRPLPWLADGGPPAAALGVSLLLVAAFTHDGTLLDRHLGYGLPAELGRMAFPLLVLHYPVFWAVQLVVPTVRPFALLVIGGLLAWLLGVLLQDGVVKRLHARFQELRTIVPAVLLVGAAIVACTVAGAQVAAAGQRVGRDAPRPTVLVLGDSTAGDLAVALAKSRYTVVDGSQPGCGLLAAPSGLVLSARTTALAQAPATAWDCSQRETRWRDQVAAVEPAAIVVSLDTDGTPGPGTPSPCDPAFRALYRPLFAKAVDLWSAGDPGRPVLLAIPAHLAMSGTARCFDALLAESAGSYGAVVPLDPKGSVAGAVAATLDGTTSDR